MTITKRLMGMGVAAGAAQETVGSVAATVSAAGTTQTDATNLGFGVNVVTTVASGAGVKLYINADRGDWQVVYNNGANALAVYPPTSNTINGGSANAAYTVAVGSVVTFQKVTDTAWVANSGSAATSTFTPSGTGAVTRTVQAKLREILSITDFNGVTYDGSTDDLSAINTAIAANPGKAFYFPAGSCKVSGTIVAAGDNTKIYGAGSNNSTIINSSTTAHAVKFYPNNTATTTTFINLPAIENIGIYSAVDKTSGAGVYALQCNGLRVFDVKINNHPEGLVVSGGQLNTLDGLKIFASASVLTGTPVSSSQALRFCEAPIDGGLYQDCFTVEVNNLFVAASRVLDKSIRIESCDGLHFNNAYVSGAYSDEVFIKVLTAGRYIGDLRFNTVYLDGVSMTTAPTSRNGINIPASAVGTVYSVHFNNGQIGNYTGNGCVVTEEVNRLTFTGGTEFVNIDNWAIDVTGSVTATEVIVTGCTFTDVGEVTTNKGGISINTALNIVITSNSFKGIGNTGASAISTSGTNANCNIDSNAFSGCTANITDTATWTGNASGIWIAFTPSITFATPGDLSVSYSTRIGRSLRKGNVCHATVTITTSAFSHTTASGNLQITGFPVTSTTATQVSMGPLAVNGITLAGHHSFNLRRDSNNTLCSVEASGSAVAIATITAAEVPTGGTVILHGSITYECLP